MGARVLFVVPNVPYPLATGGHLRDWQILNLLARRGIRPALLYFGAGEAHLLADDAPIHRLAAGVAFGGARIEEPDGSAWTTLARKLSYVSGAGTTHPFAYQYDAMRAEERILREAARVGAEVVVLRSFWCHHAARLQAAGLRVVANCPDSNTRLAREMVRSVGGLAAKLGPLCNLAGVRRLEATHLGRADEIWVPTASEREEIAALGGTASLVTLPNLVDVDAYPNLASAVPEDDTLLFVANFAYPPNANAARRLLRLVFPALRRLRPRARLLLVGGGMAPAVRRMAETTAGVEVPGFVRDLTPWYRRAAVVVLPVRQGAGMLFKTIEALAHGKATVGFPEAYRGIDADAGSAFLTSDRDADLAKIAARLLEDGAARRMLGEGARALAAARLSWDHGVRCLEESLVARLGG
ncbi:MAG: glycosyltransferase [Candidatus Binatia bacterium]